MVAAEVTEGRPTLPLLLYHWFRSGPRESARSAASYTIAPEKFESHLLWLKSHGYTSVPLDSLLDNRPLPPKPVILTFDDGAADFYHLGAPLLEKHGFTADVFLVAGRVGGEVDWDPAMPRRPMLTWAQIKELKGRGFAFGSHTYTHPRLSRLGLEPMERELVLSRNQLADELGEPPRWLAYPYGDYDHRVMALAKELGYKGALAVTLKPLDLLKSRPFARARLQVKGGDSLAMFRFRLWLAGQIPTLE